MIHCKWSVFKRSGWGGFQEFTTAEITVSAPVTANVASNVDIDGMVDNLSACVLEAMEQAAEGVH